MKKETSFGRRKRSDIEVTERDFANGEVSKFEALQISFVSWVQGFGRLLGF